MDIKEIKVVKPSKTYIMALLLRTQVTLENFRLLIWISFEVIF